MTCSLLPRIYGPEAGREAGLSEALAALLRSHAPRPEGSDSQQTAAAVPPPPPEHPVNGGASELSQVRPSPHVDMVSHGLLSACSQRPCNGWVGPAWIPSWSCWQSNRVFHSNLASHWGPRLEAWHLGHRRTQAVGRAVSEYPVRP